MFSKKLGYDTQTQKLIDRMCVNVERLDFKLEKAKGLDCLLKTYDLFGLKRPTKVVWVKDIFDKKFIDAAGSAYSAYSARSAGSAGSAYSAGSAGSAYSAGSAGSAYSAGSAGSAYSARSALDVYLEWTALDYDFNWFLFEYEYCKNPDKEFPPNENDSKYLKYSELLMKAKEYGVGYWVEWNGTLYLAPTPIVKIDQLNRFHSTKVPAIKWKGGHEFYYLNGLNFEKALWTKIVKDKLTPDKVFKIENLEQRRIAYELMDKTKMKKLKNYKVLDRAKDDLGKPMKIIQFNVKGFEKPFIYYQCIDATTKREYFVETDKTTCKEAKAGSFGFNPDEIDYKFEY